jgi:FlaA1/EpsC-like NDP-sugar epimerase
MNTKRILIIGAGEAGKMVLEEILKTTKISSKYNIIGFLDDDKNKKAVLSVPVLGAISRANEIIENNNINEVIIAIPSASKETINNIVSILPEAIVRIKIVPGFFEIIDGTIKLSQIREIEPTDLLGREEVDFNLDQITPFYKDKTIFITGAGGSIGSEIFAQLLLLPVKKIVAYGHGENSIHSLINKYGKDKRFNYVIGDIKDLNKLRHEISKHRPDIVFHAAAHKHVRTRQ